MKLYIGNDFKKEVTMALEIKDIQREGMLAGRLAELSEVVLNQANAMQKKDEAIKILEARVTEFESKLTKDVVKDVPK
jgi:uncharacterized coiled-coil protein SlyX